MKLFTKRKITKWIEQLQAITDDIQDTFDSPDMTGAEAESEKGLLVTSCQSSIEESIAELQEIIDDGLV